MPVFSARGGPLHHNAASGHVLVFSGLVGIFWFCTKKALKITNLVPGINDEKIELKEMAGWICDRLIEKADCKTRCNTGLPIEFFVNACENS